MLQSNGADYKEYKRKLQVQLEPLLSQLAVRRQVVWFNQFATNDFWGGNKQHNVDVFADKIHQYNLIAQRVFK